MSIPSELRARVLELPEAERAELAHDLILSLEPEGTERDPDYEAAWAAEIEERIRKFDSGESVAIPAEEALAQIRESLRKARQA